MSTRQALRRFSNGPFIKTTQTYRCGPAELCLNRPELFLEVSHETHKYYSDHKIPLYSEEGYSRMHRSGKLAANTLRMLCDVLEEGMSTYDIHEIAKKYIESNGAIASSIGYYGFPGSICTSANYVCCHGIPRKDEILKNGDVISLDVTCNLDGFYGDTCYTYYIGDYNQSMSIELALFLYATQKCRDYAIENVCNMSGYVHWIGICIENYLKQFNEKYGDNYEVLREFTGHGVGTEIHQSPEILHFGREIEKEKTNKEGILMRNGLMFTVEPIVLLNPFNKIRMDGRRSFIDTKDKWTVRVPNTLSAQFEHCVGINEEGKPEIFTLPDDPFPDVWTEILRKSSQIS